MFREMRRNRQLLSHEECEAILKGRSFGVLAVLGDEGYPYAVPLSFSYANGKIYFHGAKSGHKIDAIRQSDKVTFCVVDKDEIVPQEFTSYFRSVIVFGRAKLLESDDEKRYALKALAAKYSPNESDSSRDAEIAKSFAAVGIIELTIEHMTGKEAIELVRKKAAQS